jgi:RNA polymerase sigma factor (sigma-70 family)
MTRQRPSERPSEDRLPEILTDFFSDRQGADDALCSVLLKPVSGAVGAYLGRDNVDADDVIQESLVAVIQYLKRRGEFEGNLVRFAVTIARNRCRNILNWRQRRPHVEIEPLADWITNTEHSALDSFLDQEALEVMRSALDDLTDKCRNLLSSLFLENKPIEHVRQALGLSSVRAVYYQREGCLEQLHTEMNRSFGGNSA